MMIILEWVKKNFFNVVILILIAVILLQKCNKDNIPAEKPSVKTDTVWVVKQNTVITKPTLVKTIPGKPGTNYVPDPNYAKLVLQYTKLVEEHIALNVYKDTIKLDSIGHVYINDTVNHNNITYRKVAWDLKYPTITKTITLPPLRNNQIYYGGGLQGGPQQLINQFNVGVLLKTKTDHIYNVYTGLDMNGQVQVGLQTYWKIKLRK
jgi:hypothetical protein